MLSKTNRNWVFTHNKTSTLDWKPWLESAYEKLSPKYIGGQLEQVAHLHIQGFVCFKEPVRLAKLKEFDDATHWEPMKGTPA